MKVETICQNKWNGFPNFNLIRNYFTMFLLTEVIVVVTNLYRIAGFIMWTLILHLTSFAVIEGTMRCL